MKIKYNIDNIKEKINNIKLKFKNKKENKIPKKYYALLILMLFVGMITLTTNVKMYKDVNSENYTKYTLDNNTQADSNKVALEEYETAISSISTNVANLLDELENTDNISSKEETNIKYIYPVEGTVIKKHSMDTLVYSKTLDMWGVHSGIDILADLGENVVATADGEIIDIEENSFYGNTIKIKHTDGYVSVYSNIDILDNIIGDKVKQGEIIGKVSANSYGELADETHLHFEILKDNEWINPSDILE